MIFYFSGKKNKGFNDSLIDFFDKQMIYIKRQIASRHTRSIQSYQPSKNNHNETSPTWRLTTPRNLLGISTPYQCTL